MCERRALTLLSLLVLMLLVASSAVCQQDTYERMVAPGVKYTRLYRPAGPWAIHIVEVDTTVATVQVATALAGDKVTGLEPLSASAARASTDQRYAVVGVNGDYFIRSQQAEQGDPLGLHVLQGEMVSMPSKRSALMILKDGSFQIAVPALEAWVETKAGKRKIDGINQRRRQDELILYTPRFNSSTRQSDLGTEVTLLPADVKPHHGAIEATVTGVFAGQGNMAIPADGWVLSGSVSASAFLRSLQIGDKVSITFRMEPGGDQVVEAIGGGPRIVRDGAVSVEAAAEEFSSAFALQRHPRTAVGLKGKRLLLIAVDGRRPTYSEGISLVELANLMLELGCDQAMNLDGGGSTTVWLRGQVQNVPSDGSERPVANDLLVFSTAPKGPPVRLVLEPGEIRILAGHSVGLSWRLEDENYNPVSTTDPLVWQTSELGSVSTTGQFTAPASRSLPARGSPRDEGPLKGSISASAAGISASIPATVYYSPPSLTIRPEKTRLIPGQSQQFAVLATDREGRPITFDARQVAWEAPAEVGEFVLGGLLRAGQKPGRGVVRATLAGSTAQAVVIIGSVVEIIEDFERPKEWAAFVWPREVQGSFSRAKVEGGSAWAGMLKYDFTNAGAPCAAYARFDRTIGAASALRVRVRGDGSGHWLRARLKDAAGNQIVLDLARRVDWKDEWRVARAAIPGAPQLLILEAIYIVETDPARRDAGTIYIDDVQVERPE